MTPAELEIVMPEGMDQVKYDEGFQLAQDGGTLDLSVKPDPSEYQGFRDGCKYLRLLKRYT